MSENIKCLATYSDTFSDLFNNRFFKDMPERLENRKSIEEEYNSYLQKAKQTYDNDGEKASWLFLASFICYLYYDANPSSASGRDWAVSQGYKAINQAVHILDDVEYRILQSLWSLLRLKTVKNFDERFLSACKIKKSFPVLHNLPNMYIKESFWEEHIDLVYLDLLYATIGELDLDSNLIPSIMNELRENKNTSVQLWKYAHLSEYYLRTGNYAEAQRLAVQGKNILGELDKIDPNDTDHINWGNCWWVYASCQEKQGELDFAFSLYERGAEIGDLCCISDVVRFYDQGICDDVDKEKALYWCKQAYDKYGVDLYQSLTQTDSCATVLTDSPVAQIESSLVQDESPKNQSVVSSVEISSNEQEYLEELKECLANGSISDSERRLLNKIRSKLGISEARASELEQSLLKPQLTEDEKEYLDAFKDAMEDGVISDAERRLLDKIKKYNGLSDERAKEIESSFLENQIPVKDACNVMSEESDENVWENLYNQKWLLSHNDEAIKLYKLAEQYDDEDNVELYNIELAKTYCQQSIALGYAPAMDEYAAILSEEGRCEDAFALYKQAAQCDYEPAKLMLALCYRDGDGVDADFDKAIEICKEIADVDSFAQYLLGDINDRMGKSKEAVFWYTQSAHGGVSTAWERLGHLYYFGRGDGSVYPDHDDLPVDYNSAFKFFSLAYEKGVNTVSNILGDCYYNGKGTKCDPLTAIKFYKEAAANNESLAFNSLGDIYMEGKFVPQDVELAIKYYESGAELGDEFCAWSLYGIYGYGEWEGKINQSVLKLPRYINKSRALYWLERLVEMGETTEETLKEAREELS